MRTQLHSLSSPSIEVSLHVNRATAALVGTHRPVLLEGLGAVDGGLVGALGLSDLVGGAVSGDGALDGSLRGGVVGAKVLDDVVFDQRVAGPAVDGEVGVAGWVVGSGVGDGAKKKIQFLFLIIGGSNSYRAAPGFQPFPPTRLPPVFQLTL